MEYKKSLVLWDFVMCSVRFVLSFMFFGAFSAYSSAYYVSDKLIFSSLPNGASTSENELCRLDSELYVEHLENMTLWAHQSKLKKIIFSGCIYINIKKLYQIMFLTEEY